MFKSQSNRKSKIFYQKNRKQYQIEWQLRIYESNDEYTKNCREMCTNKQTNNKIIIAGTEWTLLWRKCFRTYFKIHTILTENNTFFFDSVHPFQLIIIHKKIKQKYFSIKCSKIGIMMKSKEWFFIKL